MTLFFFLFLFFLSGAANVCQNGSAFEIQSVKVKHTLWPRSVAGSPRGGVTSAIDPDFKKGNRWPAGSVARRRRLAVAWTHCVLPVSAARRRAPSHRCHPLSLRTPCYPAAVEGISSGGLELEQSPNGATLSSSLGTGMVDHMLETPPRCFSRSPWPASFQPQLSVC